MPHGWVSQGVRGSNPESVGYSPGNGRPPGKSSGCGWLNVSRVRSSARLSATWRAAMARSMISLAPTDQPMRSLMTVAQMTGSAISDSSRRGGMGLSSGLFDGARVSAGAGSGAACLGVRFGQSRDRWSSCPHLKQSRCGSSRAFTAGSRSTCGHPAPAANGPGGALAVPLTLTLIAPGGGSKGKATIRADAALLILGMARSTFTGQENAERAVIR